MLCDMTVYKCATLVLTYWYTDRDVCVEYHL